MKITLRQYQLSDIDHFTEWARDPEVLRFSKLQHWVHHNSSREDFLRYFKEAIPRPWYRAICLNGSHPIGFICIESSNAEKWNRARAILSYALSRDYWGRGIATSAIRMAVLNAFQEIPDLLRIEAVVHPDNKASQRVLEKLGFVEEGILRKYLVLNGEGVDHIMYNILSADCVHLSE